MERLMTTPTSVTGDLEGVDLGRTGSIDTLQLCGSHRGTTFIRGRRCAGS